MRSGYPDLIFVYRYMIIVVQLLQSNNPPPPPKQKYLLKVLLTICSIRWYSYYRFMKRKRRLFS